MQLAVRRSCDQNFLCVHAAADNPSLCALTAPYVLYISHHSNSANSVLQLFRCFSAVSMTAAPWCCYSCTIHLSLLELLTVCDMALQHRHVLQDFMTDMALQVLLQHAFCVCHVEQQGIAFLQLATNIRYIDEKGCCKGVPVLLVLQCC